MTQNAAADGIAPLEDTGLACLAIVGRFHGIPVDPNQLRHDFAKTREKFGAGDLVLAARRLGLKARKLESDWARLAQTALPALIQQGDGNFLVAAKIVEDRILLHDTATNQPVALTRAEFEQRWNGSVILITKRSLLPGMSGKFDLSWFIPSIVKYRKQFGEVIASSFFLQLLGLITPLFFQVIIDKVLVHNGLTTLDVLAIGLMMVAIFEVTLGGLRTYLFSHTTNRVDVELGARLYHHMQRLPIAFFQSRPVGTVVARVRELESVRSFITGSALTVAIDAVFTVVFFAVMYVYSATLFWIVLATIPFYGALSYFVTPILRKRLDDKFARTAENQAFLVESVHAAETVKAMAVEPQMQRRWEEQLAGYVTAAFRAGQLGNVANQIATLISRVATVATLWVGARLVMQGDLTIGQLVAFNMLAGRVSGPILRVVQLWQDFQQARVSIEKLGDILNSPPEPGYSGQRSSLARVQGRVTFDRVSFRYSLNRPEAVKSISIDVRPGEIIGIVGRSGSGKSTFSKLIQRLYVPESGRVSIDGTDLALIDPSSLRRQIGVVLQENVVFRRSVRENIALADPGAPLEAVIEAGKLAGAHEFILELPYGYETIIEEHGANLSGGQRQRIAIARALLTNPRVLIFDEATSALDYESERIIQENMRLICKGRTVFVIAHRLSAVKPSDRIIMLDKGEIIEEGSHRELIARGGHYAALFNQQAA